VSEFWKTSAASVGSGPLTEEEFFEAMRAASDTPPHPCSQGQHLVTKKEKDRGYGVCGDCGQPVGRWP